MAGQVRVVLPNGEARRGGKPGELLPEGSEVSARGARPKYVSRAGLKLERALDAFGIDPAGRFCADIGISTGGFTDCLLSRGARVVHGVDVAYGAVAWSIRSDPRVILHERTNARTLPPEFFPEPIEVLVADLSFIGLTLVLPAIAAQLASDAKVVLLVKPQFELPREQVGAGGIVEGEARLRALDQVRAATRMLGLAELGVVDSPIAGADGNVELLLGLAKIV
ncbi:MAG: TlyA family RNA methyltransferase [Deltaproteobacteria bacterium]|nr:TlyA family RNA methyltransferase [Deltaproteobacteria bacterium]